MTLKLAKEPDNYQKNTMLETITGYFDNDIWDINTEEMQELMKYNERINRKQHNLNFSGIPEPIKLEAKYWIWWRFTNDTITAHSAFGVVLVLRKIGEFIENYSYEKGSKALIRATEATVLERIPPRVASIGLAFICINPPSELTKTSPTMFSKFFPTK